MSSVFHIRKRLLRCVSIQRVNALYFNENTIRECALQHQWSCLNICLLLALKCLYFMKTRCGSEVFKFCPMRKSTRVYAGKRWDLSLRVVTCSYHMLTQGPSYTFSARMNNMNEQYCKIARSVQPIIIIWIPKLWSRYSNEIRSFVFSTRATSQCGELNTVSNTWIQQHEVNIAINSGLPLSPPVWAGSVTESGVQYSQKQMRVYYNCCEEDSTIDSACIYFC